MTEKQQRNRAWMKKNEKRSNGEKNRKMGERTEKWEKEERNGRKKMRLEASVWA